jgi:hypothetical protein
MFKQVSKFDWREREDVRLRVARLRVPLRVNHDHLSSAVHVRVPIRRRPIGTRGRLKATRDLLSSLLNLVRRRRS